MLALTYGGNAGESPATMREKTSLVMFKGRNVGVEVDNNSLNLVTCSDSRRNSKELDMSSEEVMEPNKKGCFCLQV